MSFEHKAFAFDSRGFSAELEGILSRALASSSSEELLTFIEQQRASLRDPYEGEPLGSDWRSHLDVHDVHQCGDFALTKYYDPSDDIGLASQWQQTVEWLDRAALPGTQMVLGSPIGPSDQHFDPGKMGSYLQTAASVVENQAVLSSTQRIDGDALVRPLLRMYERAAALGSGLYVTF